MIVLTRHESQVGCDADDCDVKTAWAIAPGFEDKADYYEGAYCTKHARERMWTFCINRVENESQAHID